MKVYRSNMLRLARRLRRVADERLLRGLGGVDRPVFYDVRATCPALMAIEEHYDEIRAELEAVLPEQERAPRYHDVDAAQENLSESAGQAWRVLFLYMSGAPRQPNEDLCPKTREIIRRIPGVIQAFYSILEPGKDIPAHEAKSMAYLRYHMAFKVPAKNAPLLRVKDERYRWKERESILWDDTWDHEVTNEAEESRIVLIIDILRPAPWHLDALNRLVGWVTRRGVSRAEWLDAVAQRSLEARH